MKKVLHSLFYSALLLLTLESATRAQGVLTGAPSGTAGSSINLTTEGVTDWSHWGYTGATQDHKAVAGTPVGLISDETLTAATGVASYGDNQATFSWTDGTPTPTVTNTPTGIYTGGGGFTFTVPANTSNQTLKVYVGGYQAGAQFTASLSDGSAPDYNDSSLNPTNPTFAPDGNHVYGVYSVTFKAASAGQTLTITYAQTTGSGNVTLQAATLFPTPTTVPAAPTNLVATAGTNRVSLTWNGVTSPGVSGYNVKRNTAATGTFTTIGTVTSTNYQDFTAVNGTKYFYEVTAVNNVGESLPSNVASATPQPGIDGTGLTGSYYLNGTGSQTDNTPGSANFTFATTPNLTELDATVNFNSGNTPIGIANPWPDIVNASPNNFSAKWVGAISVPLTGTYIFATSSDDGSGIYLDGTLIVSNFFYQGATLRSSSPILLTAGTKHTIRVPFFQGGGGYTMQLLWTPPGQAQQIIPSYVLFPNASLYAPPAVTLTGIPGAQSATLTYGTPENAVSYNILRSLTPGGPYTTIATGVTVGTYKDTGLTNGTTYYYVVQAVNAIGTGPNSNELAITPTPPFIGNGVGLAGTYYAGGNADFSSEATDPILSDLAPTVNYNNGNSTGYNPISFPSGLPGTNFTAVWSGQVLAPYTGSYIFQTITDDGSRLTIDSDTATGIVLFDDEAGHGPQADTGAAVTMTAGKKYNIKFEFVQQGGGATAQLLYNPLGSGFVIIPQTQLFAVFTAAPVTPTNLTAGGGNNVVYLNWTPTQGAITYNVLRSLTPGGPYTTIATGVAGASYNDTTVTNGTTYYYVVAAVNNIGTSGNSNEASATPRAPIIGNGNGLAATYYVGGDVDFTIAEATTPILYNITPTVNFNVGTTGVLYNPIPFPSSLPATNFTAVYSGQFLAPFTGAYLFQTNSDDGSQLSLDTGSGYQIIVSNDLLQAATAVTSAPITLTAGQKYNIKMEYVQSGGNATAQLLYNPVGAGFAIIPQTQLFTNFTAAPAAPANLTAIGGSSLVSLSWSSSQGAFTYNVLRSLTPGGPYTAVATGLTNTAYTDMTVTNGTTYHYVVVAVNNIGTSSNSNEASATPALPALTLHYTFENGPSGTNPDPVTDVSGHSNDGRIVGGDAGFTHDAPQGVWAGLTASTTEYVALPDAFDFGNQFTFFTFVKLTTDASGIQTILGTNGSAGSTGGFALYVNDSNDQSHAIVVETNTGTASAGGNVQTKTRTAAGVFPFDGQYHAVAAVINRTGGTVSIYLDGKIVLADGIIDTQWPTMSGGNRLGEFPSNDELALNSQFDDVRVYNGLLNAADIAAFSTFGATVTGKIALEGVANLAGISPAAPLGTFHIGFRAPGAATETFGKDVTLTTTAGSPNGSFTVTDIPDGTYDVTIEGAKNLRVLLLNVTIAGSTGTLTNVTLPAGDANGDNSVDTSDFSLLVGSYGGDSSVPGSGYDPAEDFNFDGVVDTSDFSLLVGEYGNVGAP